jgi:hypothetical protein
LFHSIPDGSSRLEVSVPESGENRDAEVGVGEKGESVGVVVGCEAVVVAVGIEKVGCEVEVAGERVWKNGVVVGCGLADAMSFKKCSEKATTNEPTSNTTMSAITLV